MSTATRERIIGTWRLNSVVFTTASGVRNDTPYGSQPTGRLTYTADGHMSALISYSDRKPLSVLTALPPRRLSWLRRLLRSLRMQAATPSWMIE